MVLDLAFGVGHVGKKWWHDLWYRHMVLEKEGLVNLFICARRFFSEPTNSEFGIVRADQEVMHRLTGLSFEDVARLVSVKELDDVDAWLESVGHVCPAGEGCQ